MHGAFLRYRHVSKSALEDFGGFKKVPIQNTWGLGYNLFLVFFLIVLALIYVVFEISLNASIFYQA